MDEEESLSVDFRGHSHFWNKKLTIPGTPWEICGFSRSAYRTGFYISALDMALDAGPCCTYRPCHIFITHTHLDHVVSLPFLVNSSKRSPDVYGPAKAESFIKDYITATFSLNALSNIKHTFFTYHPMEPNTNFIINANKTNLIVDTFRCNHSIPTIGYGFSEIREKLKSSYYGMEGPELKKRKLEGETITEQVIFKKFAYICDSTIAVLDNHPDILDYKVVFIECTFLYPDEEDLAKKKKHIHWQHLRPFVQKCSDVTFILFHFSQRYRDKEILSFFKKESAQFSFSNVICWV